METESDAPGAGKKAQRVELARPWNFPGRAPSSKVREARTRTCTSGRGAGWGSGVGLRLRGKTALGAGEARLSRAKRRARSQSCACAPGVLAAGSYSLPVKLARCCTLLLVREE